MLSSFPGSVVSPAQTEIMSFPAQKCFVFPNPEEGVMSSKSKSSWIWVETVGVRKFNFICHDPQYKTKYNTTTNFLCIMIIYHKKDLTINHNCLLSSLCGEHNREWWGLWPAGEWIPPLAGQLRWGTSSSRIRGPLFTGLLEFQQKLKISTKNMS